VDLLELPTRAQSGSGNNSASSGSSSKAGGNSSHGHVAAAAAAAGAPKQVDLFGLDPATILEAVAPSKLAMMGDLAKGLCLGVRAIAQLLATVDAIAGKGRPDCKRLPDIYRVGKLGRHVCNSPKTCTCT
jgi:hypothetical protein